MTKLIKAHSSEFTEVLTIIKNGRSRAFQAVNLALIETNCSFERTILADLKLAPPVRELHQDVAGTFKDTYLLDFLNLPEPHLEADLQTALLIELAQVFA